MADEPRPAPLPRSIVDRLDHNGAWGPMGKRYLTVRFRDPENTDDLVEIMMEVLSVASSQEDEYQRHLNREDK